jgi:phosphate transport system substrate-binding protein
MRIMKKSFALVLAAVVSLTLTACDPPIPASLLVAEAEKTVYCETGSQTLYADAGYADLTFSWTEIMASQCEEMILDPADDIASANLVMRAEGAPSCEARVSAPAGFEAGAVAFFLDAAFALTLDLQALVDIYDGKITSWADPALVELNPEVEFEDIPIQVVSDAPSAAINALKAWVNEELGSEPELSLLTANDEADFRTMLGEFENGTIGLFPYSLVSVDGGTYAAVATLNASGEVEVLSPSPQSIYVASTRWKPVLDGEFLKAEFDQTSEAEPFPGTAEAGEPYQLVYPVFLDLCGEQNMLQSAIARYIVRLDAQGLMATSTLGALPEKIRIESAAHLGRDLPPVEVDPESIGG